MHYYEYVNMFIVGMTRLTGDFTPHYYEALFTSNALNDYDTKKLLNILYNSEYNIMHVSELNEYFSDYSACNIKDYARSFIQSIELMENLNTFCRRNDVPVIARSYIIDKIIACVDEIKDVLLTTWSL